MELEYIIRDKESGLCFIWNGAHTVNVRWGRDSEDAENHDVFSVGSFADDRASFEDFEAGVKEYLAEDNE